MAAGAGRTLPSHKGVMQQQAAGASSNLQTRHLLFTIYINIPTVFSGPLHQFVCCSIGLLSTISRKFCCLWSNTFCVAASSGSGTQVDRVCPQDLADLACLTLMHLYLQVPAPMVSNSVIPSTQTLQVRKQQLLEEKRGARGGKNIAITNSGGAGRPSGGKFGRGGKPGSGGRSGVKKFGGGKFAGGKGGAGKSRGGKSGGKPKGRR